MDCSNHINIGVGKDLRILDLAELVKKVVGYTGQIIFDASKSDGPPQKLLNVDKINGLGWVAKTTLKVGLRMAYEDFINTHDVWNEIFFNMKIFVTGGAGYIGSHACAEILKNSHEILVYDNFFS